jgi:hypothetical protein
MKKIGFGLFLGVLFMSCNSNIEEEVFNRTQIDIPHDNQDEIEDIPDQDSIKDVVADEDQQLIESVTAFFNWYKANWSAFYKKQGSCVKTVDEYYMVDSLAVNNYASFLANSGHFSNLYITRVKSEWLDNCGREVLVDKNNGVKADGPPHCVYEGDVFFLTQEEPTEASFEALDIKVKGKEHGGTIVHTGVSNVSWVKENGVWKILSI